MEAAIACVIVTIGASTCAYIVGRMVGEERGRVDAYRRVAEARRRTERAR